ALIAEQTDRVRERFRASLREVTDLGRELLKNHEEEEVRAVIREAGQLLRTWLNEHEMPVSTDARLNDSLLSALEIAHASTIHACMRRRGEWQNLSYSHQLGHGARRIGALALGDEVNIFRDYCHTLSR